MSVASVRPCARSLRLVPLVLVLPCIAAAQSSAPTQPGPAQVPPPPATAAPAPAPAPHPSQWSGKPYSWASFGTTFAYGQTYANANVGVGWLMRNGIAPNVEVGYAFGNSPTLWTLRPGVTWFMPIPTIHPYVGAYYTRWFVGSGLPDQNGIGGRAGISLGRVLSLGVSYDHALGCDRNCDSWTPTLSAGISY